MLILIISKVLYNTFPGSMPHCPDSDGGSCSQTPWLAWDACTSRSSLPENQQGMAVTAALLVNTESAPSEMKLWNVTYVTSCTILMRMLIVVVDSSGGKPPTYIVLYLWYMQVHFQCAWQTTCLYTVWIMHLQPPAGS